MEWTEKERRKIHDELREQWFAFEGDGEPTMTFRGGKYSGFRNGVQPSAWREYLKAFGIEVVTYDDFHRSLLKIEDRDPNNLSFDDPSGYFASLTISKETAEKILILGL